MMRTSEPPHHDATTARSRYRVARQHNAGAGRRSQPRAMRVRPVPGARIWIDFVTRISYTKASSKIGFRSADPVRCRGTLLSEPARLCAAIGTARLWKLLNRLHVQPQARQPHARQAYAYQSHGDPSGAIAHYHARIRVWAA